MKAVACGLALVCGSPAWAQEAPPSRPSEAEMFGGDEPRAEPAEPSPPAAPATEAARPSEDALFGNTAPASPNTPPRPAEDAQSAQAATNAFETGRGDPDDPLRIGGQFYLRTLAALDQRKKLDATQLSAPTIVDAYFDARPNERLRGMLLARLQYDPTLDPNRPSFLNSFSSGTALPGAGNAQGQGQTGGGNVNNNPNAATASTARNPALYLDQLWVRFDVARTAFFTVGRQHVKWGASRFWTPTDYLNYDFRDPLAPFDIRLGTNMIKVHLPWEERGWNFYAYGLLDNAGPANTLSRVGGAARAEVVLGSTEVAVGAVYVRGRRPRYALDFSSALGPVDVYGEVALRQRADFPRYRFSFTPEAVSLDQRFEAYSESGAAVLPSTGASWTFAISESDTLTLGAEYFYNAVGYSDARIYPWLIFTGNFRPFYIGQHYLGAYAVLPSPGSWERASFTFSNLANLSDASFLTRLDAQVRVLTHLNLEFYGQVHSGEVGGEFRFGLDLRNAVVGDQELPRIFAPYPVVTVGAGFRFAI